MQEEMIRIMCRIANVQMVRETKEGKLTAYFEDTENSPLIFSEELRKTIREHSSSEGDVYFERDFGCYYVLFKDGEDLLFLGPLAHDRLSVVRLRQMYYFYGIDIRDPLPLKTFTIPEIRDLVILMNGILHGEYDPNTVQILHVPAQDSFHQKNSFRMAEEAQDNENVYRHSYQEEQALMDAVREGKGKEAVALCETMDRDAGRLSKSDLTHRRYIAIIGITMCSRAAIQGGISPGTAYRLSGYYIQKCDEAVDAQSLYHLRNKAVLELTERVDEENRRRKSSNYVARIKNYVKLHYREKIMLDELSEEIGLNPTYVSRLFKKETGIRLQDYINMVRIERAEQLLAYTDLSLPSIADYVHFPNQSYFGKIFKEIHGISPKVWRDRFRTDELSSSGIYKKG